MGDIVKVERDNKALAAALAEWIKKEGLKPTTQLGNLPWYGQSWVLQRAYALRKDFE